MESDNICNKYIVLYESLRSIAIESQARILSSNEDVLFSSNVNFFVKSYLITMCTYLEAYLQEIAYYRSCEISERVRMAGIPFNFLYWRSSKEVKDKDLKFELASLVVQKKDISDKLSGNTYKTLKFFCLLGVDLRASQEFMALKDVVDAVVTKRNNVIHHNDKAVDVSFKDIVSYVDLFVEYMKSIDSQIKLQANK